jgi:hypothetical protein
MGADTRTSPDRSLFDNRSRAGPEIIGRKTGEIQDTPFFEHTPCFSGCTDSIVFGKVREKVNSNYRIETAVGKCVLLIATARAEKSIAVTAQLRPIMADSVLPFPHPSSSTREPDGNNGR